MPEIFISQDCIAIESVYLLRSFRTLFYLSQEQTSLFFTVVPPRLFRSVILISDVIVGVIKTFNAWF